MNDKAKELAQKAGFLQVNGRWEAGPNSSLPIYTQMLVAEVIEVMNSIQHLSGIATTYDHSTFEYVRGKLIDTIKDNLL